MTENQAAARVCTDIDYDDLDESDYDRDCDCDCVDRKPDEYDKVKPAVMAKFKKDCEGFEIINHDDLLMYLEEDIGMLNSIARIKHAILELTKPKRMTLRHLFDPEDFTDVLFVNIYIEHNSSDESQEVKSMLRQALSDALSEDVYSRVIPLVL